MLYTREVLKISSLYQSTSFHAASFLLSDAASEYQFKLHKSILNPENENKNSGVSGDDRIEAAGRCGFLVHDWGACTLYLWQKDLRKRK